MKTLILAALLLSSCALVGVSSPEKLTPEQIQAYKEQGFEVWTCFTLAGPPPAGKVTVILRPKGEMPNPLPPIVFGSECQIR